MASNKLIELCEKLIEIDCFKEYNELYGDFKGDKALIEITSKMKKSVGREINDMFRIGDKEFAIVILNREDAFIQKIRLSHW